MSRPARPTPEQLAAAAGKSVPDVIAHGLKVLFVGINPGLYTAVIGHHFGRPGNRFWPALHRSGFTSRQLSPYEENELLAAGLGISNVVPHATARADELSTADFLAGGERLRKKVADFQPQWVAILGVGAYRAAFQQPKAQLGSQEDNLAGARLWILPNPSGLNAHYSLDDLARLFAELRQEVG